MTVQKKQRQKKVKLATAGKHTKWAPFWVVVKKYGQGKKVHPSAITLNRRSWKIRKLHIKPRIIRKKHLG